MRRLTWAGCTALAVAVLTGCGEEASPRTTDTTRTLLAQPRAEDLSTTFEPSALPGGEPTLEVDLLGMNMGSADAPVKIIEFVDFGCGYCRQFQIETFPAIRAEFIETNMIEWKFLPFVSGMFANSAVVTEAAECALHQDARLFGLLQGRLWVEQAEWKRSADPEGLVRGWMTAIGADGDAFDSCVQDDTRADHMESATALAAQLGVRSTPTFWIVGVGPIQGALPLDVFREILTQVHGQLSQIAG